MCQKIIKYVVGWLKLDDDGGEVLGVFWIFAAVKVHIIKVKTFILAAILQPNNFVSCVHLSVGSIWFSFSTHS